MEPPNERFAVGQLAMGTLRTPLSGRVLWWAGSGGGEAVGTVPALLPPDPQREGSGLGLGMARHENEALEPQPLSCCFPCCLKVGLTLTPRSSHPRIPQLRP